MSDIKNKKPKVINLRKKKIIISAPVKLKIEEVKPQPRVLNEIPQIESGTFPCIKCGAKEAPEMGRCGPCGVEHKRVCATLDSRPKQSFERPKEEWIKQTEVRGGITITTYMTKEEGRMLGIKVD